MVGSQISSSLDSQINDYLLTASGHLQDPKTRLDGRQLASFGVAASSALVMMSQAEAAVVHNTGTAKPVTVVGGTAEAGANYSPFDIDGDAVDDFALFGSRGWTSAGLNGTPGAANNSVLGSGNVRKLASGASIGPAGPWQTASSTNRDVFSSGNGYSGWSASSDETGFAGVKFKIGANTHYGWVKLQIDSVGNAAIRATEWAYESCPNIAIDAGVTSGGKCVPTAPMPIPVMGPLAYGLTSLALGGLGLAGLRRRRQSGKPEDTRH